MAYRTGFCAAQDHDRCRFVAENGVRASQRYVLCSCPCHDGEQAALDRMLAVVDRAAYADIPKPLNASRDEIERFVDVVNAFLRPKGEPSDSSDFVWVPESSVEAADDLVED